MKNLNKMIIALIALLVISACSNNQVTKTETVKTTATTETATAMPTQSPATTVVPIPDANTQALDQTGIFNDAILALKAEISNIDVVDMHYTPSLGNIEIDAIDNDKEYKYVYSIMDEKIMKVSEEMLDANEKNGVERKQEMIDTESLTSLDEITQIAFKAANTTDVISISVDKDLNIVYWDFEFNTEKGKLEVKINNATKEVISIKLDD